MPVKHFSVNNLSDVIVLAGRNGVGKTRLVQGILGLLPEYTRKPKYTHNSRCNM